MDLVVLRCGDCPVPISLSTHTAIAVSQVPAAAEFDEVFTALDLVAAPRLAVLGNDAALAATITTLMRNERLATEVAYVPVDNSPAARIYETGTGARAANLALTGTSIGVPLIRDDTGAVLVGEAVYSGPDGTELVGEAYVDDWQLFRGVTAEIHVEPTPELPGLRAYARSGRRFRRKRWVSGRAIQLGTHSAVLRRDSIADPRIIRRSAFYRHHEMLRLVCEK